MVEILGRDCDRNALGTLEASSTGQVGEKFAGRDAHGGLAGCGEIVADDDSRLATGAEKLVPVGQYRLHITKKAQEQGGQVAAPKPHTAVAIGSIKPVDKLRYRPGQMAVRVVFDVPVQSAPNPRCDLARTGQSGLERLAIPTRHAEQDEER